jgi:hypothetical protein
MAKGRLGTLRQRPPKLRSGTEQPWPGHVSHARTTRWLKEEKMRTLMAFALGLGLLSLPGTFTLPAKAQTLL